MNTTPQHTLYRFYNDTGQLLYVGRTINPGQRFTDHAKTKTWWPEVRGITTETYPNADTLAAAERRAITIERPLYNIQRPALPNPQTATPVRQLIWICATCHKPIADGAGYLHVNLIDVHQLQTDEASRTEPATLAELLEHEDIPWTSHHRTCDPEPEALDYWYDVSRLRTHADLLARTAHLAGKAWIDHTDWFALIARLATVQP